MLFIALFHDKPGHTQVRLDNRQAHLDWLASLGPAMKAAGPYLDDAGTAMQGSLLILEAESLEAARAVFANDPYAKAGLFSGSEIHPWRWVVGAPKA